MSYYYLFIVIDHSELWSCFCRKLAQILHNVQNSMVSLFTTVSFSKIRELRNRTVKLKDEKEDVTDLWKYWVFG